MIILGHGQLKHHFWGDYAASIGVKFHSADLAKLAQERALPQFTINEQHPEVLQFHGTGAALKGAEAALVAAGADRKKIGSLRFSIDYGEPFTVEVNTAPAPTCTQSALF